MIIICTDANGHVGSVRRYDEQTINFSAEQWRALEDTETREYPHIGPFNLEIENTNGKVFRQFLEQANLKAINTWTAEASTYT